MYLDKTIYINYTMNLESAFLLIHCNGVSMMKHSPFDGLAAKELNR
jgi:hypothetical protein